MESEKKLKSSMVANLRSTKYTCNEATKTPEMSVHRVLNTGLTVPL